METIFISGFVILGITLINHYYLKPYYMPKLWELIFKLQTDIENKKKILKDKETQEEINETITKKKKNTKNNK